MRSDSDDIPTDIYLPAVHYGGQSQEDVDDTDYASREDEGERIRSHHAQKSGAPKHSLHIPHPHNPFHWSHDAKLAVSVQISHGRFEIEGHKLKWYHGLRQHQKAKIEISRRGGPRKEVTAAFRDKSPSLATAIWEHLCEPKSGCLIA